MTDFRLFVFNTETILAPWKISFGNIKLLKLILTKSMRKGKVDACLIRKLTINGIDVSIGYISKLSIWKQTVIILTGISNPSLSRIRRGIIAKFIFLKQAADFRLFFIHPKTFTFLFVVSAGSLNQQFNNCVNAKYSNSPSFSMKCETPLLHFLC